MAYIGCEKLGISHVGCTVVDESDGTVIDDDDALLELRDTVFVLLASGDEWTSSKQPTSPPPEYTYVDVAASTSPTTAVSASGDETEVRHAVPLFGVLKNYNVTIQVYLLEGLTEE